MISKLRQPRHLERKQTDDSLFSGAWLRWSALTGPERFVCVNIVLLPAWWVSGLVDYMAPLLAIGIALHQGWQHRKLGLKHPSLVAFALLAFATYLFLNSWFFLLVIESESLTLIQLIKSLLDSWFSFAFLLWYVQSHSIKIRPEIVAWAFTVSVIQMVGYWLFAHFVLSERSYIAPRSLFSLVTNNAEGEYEPGKGHANYLKPYNPSDTLFAGLSRFSFFFPIPELCAVFVGFIGLMALDIKSRLWSLLLFVASTFLVLISGTRSVYVLYPLLVGLRYLFSISKISGPASLFALFAAAIFVTFSVPPVTGLIYDVYADSAQTVAEARPDSTEGRTEIYAKTWAAIEDAASNNPQKVIFGHVAYGEAVGTGHATAVVGSHSFILGTLLYRSGLMGTGLFITFWISLIIWFYKTRTRRPLACLYLLILYTLLSPVMQFDQSGLTPMPLLICAAMYFPKVKSLRGLKYA